MPRNYFFSKDHCGITTSYSFKQELVGHFGPLTQRLQTIQAYIYLYILSVTIHPLHFCLKILLKGMNKVSTKVQYLNQVLHPLKVSISLEATYSVLLCGTDTIVIESLLTVNNIREARMRWSNLLLFRTEFKQLRYIKQWHCLRNSRFDS